jgi:hypothetical protein
MKLRNIHEGAVNAARGDILRINNDIATKVAHTIRILFKRKPQVEFTDDPNDPAIINLKIGAESIGIQIYGDDSIKLELSENFAKLLNTPRLEEIASADEVSDRLVKLKAIMKDEFKHKMEGS